MSVSAKDVINSLFNPNDIVNLRVFDDKKTGVFSGAKLSVEAGKFADFTVVDKNLLTIPPKELDGVKILMTVVDGKIVYRR